MIAVLKNVSYTHNLCSLTERYYHSWLIGFRFLQKNMKDVYFSLLSASKFITYIT